MNTWESAVASWVRRSPVMIALRDASRELSYHEMAPAVQELAVHLRSAGIQRCSRLMIVSENNVATILLSYAARLLGAWPALFNARAGRAELEAMCGLIRPQLMAFAADLAPAVDSVIQHDAAPLPQDGRWGRILLARRTTDRIAEPESTPVGLLLFTSGSTGLPKAVMWSEDALLRLGATLASSRHTSAGDVVQAAGPVSHIMGVSNWMAALAAGATLQLMPRLEIESLTNALIAGEITHLSLVPTAYRRLCDHLERNPRWTGRHRLRYISSGGAMLDASLKSRVERLLGLRLVNGYGMTECAPGSRTRQDIDSPASCIGWAEAGTEMRIDGDAVGELLMRSRCMMLGYLADRAATASVLCADGWLATGDLARQLPDGSYEIVGRRKEMIIRSGFNVYPAEVEAALNSLAGVRQSAVVGRRADDGDECIEAYVELHAGSIADASQLMDALRNLLAPYKRPQKLHFVDQLPLGANGKVRKHLLTPRDRL